MKVVFLFFILQLFIVNSIKARPAYYLQSSADCQSCHITPYGSGQRTDFGKVFGSHGQELPKLKGVREYLSFDGRILGYYSPHKIEKKSGVVLMSSIVSLHVPISKKLSQADAGWEIVGAYDLGLFDRGVREAYLLWTTDRRIGQGFSYMIGRFQVPFGLMTDEHRTYSRMMSLTTNREFESGMNFVFRGFSDQLHVDLGLVNGFQTGGKFVQGDLTYAWFINSRFKPSELPVFLGVSHIYHQARKREDGSARAYAFYGGIDFRNITQGYLPLTLLYERSNAYGFNNPKFNKPYIEKYFLPEEGFDNYKESILRSDAVADLVMARFRITRKFKLFAKYDRFILDKEFPGDAYTRYGVGVDSSLATGVNLQVRFERAATGREGISSDNSFAGRDAMFAVLSVWY